MEGHGGNLPPDPSKAPSLESQILDANWKRETKNGYDFHIDVVARNRTTFGALSLAEKVVRSRRNQAAAGKPDRLARASCGKVGTGFSLKTMRKQKTRARDLHRI
ncbi:hypothetical protein ASE85_10495 [Sphingobium sp. Leaf26]|uniref:hypothetical protein n=1 Tax=Sphingobium sp. Leaf26 TaxID=1735693 RepID=UPI000712FB6B|nr:hypothetical protein [Sphingobium sp. Leaf26]KQM99146.1 hypothetical protein ASE85_10495 [Sphingobium sp. Leaf26]